MRVHILDDYYDTLRHLASYKALDGHEVTIWTDRVTDEVTLAQRLADAEVLILFRDRTKITASLIDRLPALRLISMRGAYPHVDVEALTRKGIALASNTHADGFSVAAAELTFALIMTAARDLPSQIASARAGNWQAGVGRTLKGRLLGLYGYGRIARAVADYARAFGMQVVWWASEQGRERAAADGEVVAVNRRDFFVRPDFISAHLRLLPETRGIITSADLGLMRPDAVFINTARAGLVEPDALVASLNSGRPGRAAVDVFMNEPVNDPLDPQIAHHRIIPTPHIGFITEDELDMQFADIYDQVNAFATGMGINIINPQAIAGHQTSAGHDYPSST